MTVNTSDTKKQVAMHTDFFDRTMLAIDNGFYLEAIFREYAAIEGRLEVILGILGAPCNKNADPAERRKVNISHRIKCLKKVYISELSIGNTKLDEKFFNKLEKWRDKRNIIVHGFYKNEFQYNERSAQNEKLAKDGLTLARMLYNETKRLRRYRKSHAENDLSIIASCSERECQLNKLREDE